MSVNFRAGETFLYPLNLASKEHLWVIVTEPNAEGQFVVVNFNSLRGAKDQTVILFAREHEFVRHDTCVNYTRAQLTDKTTVQSWLDRGSAKMHRPLRPDVLKLILDSFSPSDLTKKRIVDFIRAYRTQHP